MGCGASRMDPERQAVASRFPPRLRLRLEEIKRKRNAAAMEGTLSKKKLLKEGDLSASQASADDKSLSSSHEESMRTAKVAPEPESVKEEDENNNAVEEETDSEKEGENEEDGDEEGRISNVGDGYVWPGSPSFRVYCAQALEPINTKSTDNVDIKEKPKRGDSGEIVAPLNFNEVVSEKAIERGGNGKKVKRHRKRTSNAVKHLLKVKSCYHPSCTGHHNARLLSQKTAA